MEHSLLLLCDFEEVAGKVGRIKKKSAGLNGGVTWSLSAGHLCLLHLASGLSTTGSLLWTWVPTALPWGLWLSFITPCYPEFWFRFICFLRMQNTHFYSFFFSSCLTCTFFLKEHRSSLVSARPSAISPSSLCKSKK